MKSLNKYLTKLVNQAYELGIQRGISMEQSRQTIENIKELGNMVEIIKKWREDDNKKEISKI